MLRTGRNIPSLLTPSYFLCQTNLKPRNSLATQIVLFLGCQHRFNAFKHFDMEIWTLPFKAVNMHVLQSSNLLFTGLCFFRIIISFLVLVEPTSWLKYFFEPLKQFIFFSPKNSTKMNERDCNKSRCGLYTYSLGSQR